MTPSGIQKSWLFQKVKLHAYIFETVTLTGMMAVVNLAFMPAQPGFGGIEPNPFWAIILLMAARYGFRASLLASLLAAVTTMALLSTRITDNIITVRDLMGWEYAKSAILFIIVGVLLGMLVQRHKDRIQKLQQDNDLLVKDNLTLKHGEEELRDVNVELANRVIGATDTLPMLYRYAKKLNTLDTEEIFTTLTELVMNVTKADHVSLYQVDGNHLPLHSQNGQLAKKGELKLDPALFDLLVTKRRVLSLHDILEQNSRQKELYLCGPLSAGSSGNVIALLAVEAIEFLRYNPATVRLFSVIVDWACTSLEKAQEFKNHPEELRIVQNKANLMRAKRASLQPGVISAEAVAARAGMDNRTAGPGEAPSRPQAHVPALGGIGSGPAGLGQVLTEASASLFSGAVESELESHEETEADPGDRAILQHMLSGELKIATVHGSPLAKLLTEIDGYLSSNKSEGG